MYFKQHTMLCLYIISTVMWCIHGSYLPSNYFNCQVNGRKLCNKTFIPTDDRDRCQVCYSHSSHFSQDTIKLCDCQAATTTSFYSEAPCKRYLTDDGVCHENCPTGFFSDHGRYKCYRCAIGCVECLGSSPEDCVKCGNMSLNGTCVSQCPAGYVSEDRFCVKQQDCHGYAFSGKCLKSCPTGYSSYSPSSHSCEKCHPLCATCSGPSETNCTSCVTAEGPHGECLVNCPETQPFLDRNGKCVTSCTSLAENWRCISGSSCSKNTSVVFNENCVNECPSVAPYILAGKSAFLTVLSSDFSIFYTLEDHSPCVNISTCQQTHGRVAWSGKCLTECPPPKLTFNQTCVDECPPGAPLMEGPNNCVSLNRCRELGKVRWTRNCIASCPVSARYIFNGSCIPRCPRTASYIFNKTICVPRCPYFYLQNVCIDICPSGSYGYKDSCLNNCPPGFLTDPILRMCYPNATCLRGKGGECLLDCPRFQYNDGTGMCRHACPPFRPYLEITESKCLPNCTKLTFTNNMTCLNTCTRDMYENGTQCGMCHPLCDQCINATIEGCKMCRRFENVGHPPKCSDTCEFKTVNISDIQSQLKNLQCWKVIRSDWSRSYKRLTACPSVSQMICIANCINASRLLMNHISQNNIQVDNLFVKPYYSVNSSHECVTQCPDSSPKTYSGRCTTQCPPMAPYTMGTKCVSICKNTVLFNTTCVKTCPKSSPMTHAGSCIDKCPPIAPYKMGSKCVSICKNTVLYNGTCVQTCPDVADLIYEEGCVHECPVSAPYVDGKSCVSTCPSGKGVWEKTGTSLRSCRICEKEKPFRWGDVCSGKCPPSQPFISGIKCVFRCNENQLSFNYSCLQKCPHDMPIERDGTCTNYCPPGTFVNMDLFQKKSCSNTCGSISYTYREGISTVCARSCPGNVPFVLENDSPSYFGPGKCAATCPNNHYINHEYGKKICVTKCPNDKRFLIKQDIGEIHCVNRCSNEYEFVIGNTCGKSCLPHMVTSYDNINHVFECLQTCPDYKILVNSSCSRCPDKEDHAYKGQCLSECPMNTVTIDVSLDKGCASSCPAGLYLSAEENRSVCTKKCPETNAKIYNNTCVSSCPDEAGIMVNQVECSSGCLDDTMAIVLDNLPTDLTKHWKPTGHGVCMSKCPSTVGNFTYKNVCVPACPHGMVANESGRYNSPGHKPPCRDANRVFVSFMALASAIVLLQQGATLIINPKLLRPTMNFEGTLKVAANIILIILFWPAILLGLRRLKLLKTCCIRKDKMFIKSTTQPTVQEIINKWSHKSRTDDPDTDTTA